MGNRNKLLLGLALISMMGLAAGTGITHLFKPTAVATARTCEEAHLLISKNLGKVHACKDDNDCAHAEKRFFWECSRVYNRSPYRQDFEKMVGDYYDRGCTRRKSTCRAPPFHRGLTECWEGTCGPGYRKSARIRKQGAEKRLEEMHKRAEEIQKSAEEAKARWLQRKAATSGAE